MIARPMILRRIIAAILLFGIAIGSVLFWEGANPDWITLGINIGLATIGFIFLHFRWKKKEAQAITPQKIRKEFS